MKLKEIKPARMDFLAPDQRIRIHKICAAYEGLITSASPWLLIDKLKTQFSNIKVTHSQEPDTKTVVIYVTIDPQISLLELDKILQLINLAGWFPSLYRTYKDSGWKFDKQQLISKLTVDKEIVLIQVEAKYDVDAIKIPKVLYHATHRCILKKLRRSDLYQNQKQQILFILIEFILLEIMII